MKFFVTLSVAALGVAAPAALEKRISASITLFADENYSGTTYTKSFTITEQTCVSPTLPDNINARASSVRLDGDLSHFNCRLFANTNCQTSSTGDATWFFNWNIPDLSNPDYAIEDRVRSIQCSPVD